MKKITLILIALISGTAFAQTASADADVTAQIVSPLELTKKSDLVFGIYTPNQGVATIDATTGVYDATNSTANLITGITPAAAVFAINAAENFGYDLTLPNNVVLEAADGSTLTVTGFESTASGIGTGADNYFAVGGSLYISDDQTSGDYQGTMTISVNYQ